MLQAQLVSVLHYPVVYAVVVPALRKVREGRAPAAVVAGSLNAGPPAMTIIKLQPLISPALAS
jgi:hypothetical protein